MASIVGDTTKNLPGGADPATSAIGRTAGAADTLDKVDTSQMTEQQRKTHEAQLRTQGQQEGEEKKKSEGSLKISISLDLDVEVHLTARIKGDIVIGLL